MHDSWDPDFYNEPNEFEQKVAEFKQSLINSVQSEFMERLKKLETENGELRIVKNNFDQIQREYKEKERQLERDREQMERNVKNLRLSVLLQDFDLIMYKAHAKNDTLPKCEKCDEKRNIHYISPSGRDAKEPCECSATKKFYEVVEHSASEFKVDRDKKDSMMIWYTYNDKYDSYSRSDSMLAKNVYNEEMKFEDIESSYWMYFRSEDECQKYCDWLNEKEVFKR